MAVKRRFPIALLFLTATLGFVLLMTIGTEAFAGTWYGAQGSISGDTYLVGQRYGVGAPGSASDVGSVHVFERDGASWWETIRLESLLEPGTLVTGAEFGGGAVLIEGDTAVVGAYRNKIGDQAQAGNVFVFTRSGLEWSRQTVLQMPDGAIENARFGAAGDVDGDRLLLSASGSGNAYIFTRSGDAWDEGVELLGGNIDSPLGVAIAGNLAAVGNFGVNPHVDIWQYNDDSSTWDFETSIANHGGANNLFGNSIDISGNTMVVSARKETVGTIDRAGAVFVYTKDTGTGIWSLQQAIDNPYPDVNDEFGFDVAIEGNRLVVGAPRDDLYATDAGVAYVYERSGSIWSPAAAYSNDTYGPDTPTAGLWFGEVVDLTADVLLAGGPGRTADPAGEGDMYWFDLDAMPTDPDPDPNWPGDANGDGVVDLGDLTALGTNWKQAGGWTEGDFDGNGVIDLGDLTILGGNWKTSPPALASSVPEPTSLVMLLGMSTLVMLQRRRQYHAT